MRRRIVTITLLLIAGAIVNVAVAWGFSACFGRFVFADHGMTCVWIDAHPLNDTTPNAIIKWHAGYPMRALRGEWSQSRVAEQHAGLLVIAHPLFDWSKRSNWSKSDEVWLPFHAVWPGFIINTLFYAALLWILFFASFTTRRMLRRRRGQCEECGYPIGVSPVCTECGTATTRSRKSDS